MISIIGTLLISSLSFAQADLHLVGTLYGLKSKQTEKLFTSDVDLKIEVDGTSSTQSVYKDLQGQVVVIEKGQLRGVELEKYEMDRPQTKEKGTITVNNGRVHFEYQGPDGKKKTDDEKAKGTIVCTANFNAYVLANWDQLMSGKDLDVRFAVWDRLETVGFTLQKVGITEKDGKKWLELRMKPTSFVIAALVDPLYFGYTVEDKQLRLMKGRVSPKIQKDGKWKDLDAEVVYTEPK
ncbi:hypothetical protein [Bdellovibrio sp. HCB2-146]|uniref:hypothetical protein n=1 Tax=Bdellovibrio sp. HCB2-146 TaxID=3394362 RepID=UPI0039BCE917